MACDRRTFLMGAGTGALALASGRALATRRPPLGDLARATRGALIVRGDPAYPAARAVVNARFADVRPLAILRARDAGDVRAAVRWCARTGVPVTARSGGHSYAGYSTLADGVVVDVSGLAAIRLAADRRTVRVGAGAILIDLYAALARRGLTIPAGSCPTVGIAGLALGGGVGLASRALGTTSDNVVGLRIVTADGRILSCDARHHPDLFWACRGGGGGNFGIVTDLTLRTHRVGPSSYFSASFDWEDADEVVAAWQRWAPGAPDELFSICTLSTGAGRPAVSALGQYMGPAGPLRRLVGRLTAAVPARRVAVGTAAYHDLTLRWAGCLGDSPAECRRPPRDRFAAGSAYALRPLTAAGIGTLTAAVARRQRDAALGSGAILLDSYGGAINRIAPGATAFVHRDALFSLQYLAYWGRRAGAAPARAWIRDTRLAARPHLSRFAYQNYIDPDLPDWGRAYYGRNLARLVDVKTAYDRDHLFRFRQGIAPR